MRAEILYIILGMAAVTFFTRFVSLAFFRQMGIPGWLHRWLRHIPTAILTVLIVPSLLLPQGRLDLSLQNHYLLAGLIAGLVALRSGHIIATLVSGMSAMFVLRWLTL